jgi:hypothetical protein
MLSLCVRLLRQKGKYLNAPHPFKPARRMLRLLLGHDTHADAVKVDARRIFDQLGKIVRVEPGGSKRMMKRSEAALRWAWKRWVKQRKQSGKPKHRFKRVATMRPARAALQRSLGITLGGTAAGALLRWPRWLNKKSASLSGSSAGV